MSNVLPGKVEKQLQRLNKETKIKRECHSVVDVCGGESKVLCCKNNIA